MQARHDISATGAMGAFVGASMVLAYVAVVVLDHHGIAMTFPAAWALTLLLCVPVLHFRPGVLGHGSRALTLLALLPVLALTTLMAIECGLTGSWWYQCGTGTIGLLCLPFVACAMVAGAYGAVWGLARVGGLRFLAFLFCVGAVPLAGVLAVVVATTPPAPEADARLRSEVHAIGAVPDALGHTPIDVAGSRLTRTCSAYDACRVVIDGLEPDFTPEGRLEVAEGLGYRFLRRVGSPPREWLAYRPGAGYGVQLDARSLPGAVAAPHGLGVVLAVTLLLAFLYGLAAVVRGPRIARLRAALPAHVIQPGAVRVGGVVFACDVSLPVGPAVVHGRALDVATYRTRSRALIVHAGERAALIDAEWRIVGEHCAMIASLLLIGASPVLVALRAGLVVGW